MEKNLKGRMGGEFYREKGTRQTLIQPCSFLQPKAARKTKKGGQK
ncbi:MAG TPA: hypothetical protein VGY91_06960 [Chthoniobacterales bacterium]|nr:hypothetical protein [Chthoniobacterales bacterium]